MLPADVHARFRRLQGEEVLYICATDEHGTPAEVARRGGRASRRGATARSSGRSRRPSANSSGCRGTTSAAARQPQNRELTQHFGRPARRERLHRGARDRADLLVDRRALPPRPLCRGHVPALRVRPRAATSARTATRLLDPTELINPRSAICRERRPRAAAHQAPLPLADRKLAPSVRRWIDTKDDWPLLARSIAYKWLDEGLEDRSITRDLSWGVPVEPPGLREQGVLRLVRRAHRVSSARHTEWADLDRGARLAQLVVRRRRRRLHAVHGEGQRRRSTRCSSRAL